MNRTAGAAITTPTHHGGGYERAGRKEACDKRAHPVHLGEAVGDVIRLTSPHQQYHISVLSTTARRRKVKVTTRVAAASSSLSLSP